MEIGFLFGYTGERLVARVQELACRRAWGWTRNERFSSPRRTLGASRLTWQSRHIRTFPVQAFNKVVMTSPVTINAILNRAMWCSFIPQNFGTLNRVYLPTQYVSNFRFNTYGCLGQPAEVDLDVSYNISIWHPFPTLLSPAIPKSMPRPASTSISPPLKPGRINSRPMKF